MQNVYIRNLSVGCVSEFFMEVNQLPIFMLPVVCGLRYTTIELSSVIILPVVRILYPITNVLPSDCCYLLYDVAQGF